MVLSHGYRCEVEAGPNERRNVESEIREEGDAAWLTGDRYIPGLEATHPPERLERVRAMDRPLIASSFDRRRCLTMLH